MKVTFVIENASQFEANLATLPKRVQNRVVQPAVRAAQRPMLAAAQANARALPRSERRLFAVKSDDIRMSELIARNIVIAAPRRQTRGTYALHVQLKPVSDFFYTAKGAHTKVDFNWVDRHGAARRKIGAMVGMTFIPAAIEFGHGADPQSAARPYMRPAADSTTNECMAILNRQLDLGLLREAMKGR